MVVAEGANVDGLISFAYPLHQPGHPEKSRIEHLPSIKIPALFVSGTRDTFGTPQEIKAAAELVPGSTVHILNEADHGFAVPKNSIRTKAEVYGEAVDVLLVWAESHLRV